MVIYNDYNDAKSWLFVALTPTEEDFFRNKKGRLRMYEVRPGFRIVP